MSVPDDSRIDPAYGQELFLPFEPDEHRPPDLAQERRQAAIEAEALMEDHGPSCRCRDCLLDMM